MACQNPCPSRFETGQTVAIDLRDESWEMRVEDTGICSPAFINAADLDQDGAAEVLISVLGRKRGFSLPEASAGCTPMAPLLGCLIRPRA